LSTQALIDYAVVDIMVNIWYCVDVTINGVVKMSFAENLTKEMERKRWKPAHLSAALSDIGVDCHTVTIQRYMEGGREPRASMVAAIASALDVDTSALLQGVQPAAAAVEG
jgi:transcriptional regulator with XRE-family HTH domain